MKENEQLADQIANKCKHFNGLMEKVCKAGVSYDDVKVKVSNEIVRLPCIKSGGSCSKCEFPTPEEVDAKVKQMQEGTTRMVKAYAAIKAKFKVDNEWKGKVDCTCGGVVNYVIAASNGHIAAACKSCGLYFRE